MLGLQSFGHGESRSFKFHPLVFLSRTYALCAGVLCTASGRMAANILLGLLLVLGPLVIILGRGNDGGLALLFARGSRGVWAPRMSWRWRNTEHRGINCGCGGLLGAPSIHHGNPRAAIFIRVRDRCAASSFSRGRPVPFQGRSRYVEAGFGGTIAATEPLLVSPGIP